MKFSLFTKSYIFYLFIELSEQITTGKVLIYQTEQILIDALCAELEKAAEEVIKKNQFFKIALPGGSLIQPLSRGFLKMKTDWTQWRFFFCEEQLTPLYSPYSIYGAYRRAFANTLQIPEDQFIAADLSRRKPVDAMFDYYFQMTLYFFKDQPPNFDYIILDLEPDGNTSVIYPVNPKIVHRQNWVTLEAQVRPPPPYHRISLQYHVLNNARNVVFVVLGKSKADVLKTIVEDESLREPMAAELVNPVNGTFLWLVDLDASSKLSSNIRH